MYPKKRDSHIQRSRRARRLLATLVSLLLVMGSTLIVLSLATIGESSASVLHATNPGLGTAGSYSVLAATAVTNTGPSVLSQDLGLTNSAVSSLTGFPPGTVLGTTNQGNAQAAQAESDNTAAYLNLAGQSGATSEPADLGGLTLVSGIYSTPGGAMSLTGTLTLNGQGNPNGVFIFQMASTLTTAGSSQVVLINSANPCNVFWQVGSSATLGTSSSIQGSVLALTSITATTSAVINGRLLAQNGAVTLDDNSITNPTCALPPTTTTTTAAPTTTTAAPTTTTAIGSTTTSVPATLAPVTTTTISPVTTGSTTSTTTSTIAPTTTVIAPTTTVIAPATTTTLPPISVVPAAGVGPTTTLPGTTSPSTTFTGIPLGAPATGGGGTSRGPNKFLLGAGLLSILGALVATSVGVSKRRRILRENIQED